MIDEGLDGRVALVTGGARGIGRACCLALAERGARVAINYTANAVAAADTLDEVRRLGGEGNCFRADVSRPDEVEGLLAAVEAGLGPVSLLVVNAGIAESEDPAALSDAVWRRTMEVNLDGAYRTARAAMPGMAARGDGRIVFIASVAALLPRPQLLAYAASKAGVVSLSRSLAAELGPAVRVNCVAPGPVETDMTSGWSEEQRRQRLERMALRRFGRPEEIAETVVFLLSDRAGFLTGQTLVVDGGLHMP